MLFYSPSSNYTNPAVQILSLLTDLYLNISRVSSAIPKTICLNNCKIYCAYNFRAITPKNDRIPGYLNKLPLHCRPRKIRLTHRNKQKMCNSFKSNLFNFYPSRANKNGFFPAESYFEIMVYGFRKSFIYFYFISLLIL